MAADNRASFPIRDPRQIELLGSTARQEVLDALQALGPCSIAALAEALGRAPDSLYYHVRKLQRAGLVVAGAARTEGRREALYDTPGRMVVDHEPTTARERRLLVRLVGAALRSGERDLRAAFASGLAVYRGGARRNAWGARTKGWLTAAELAEARAHLAAVVTLLARGRKRPGAGLHAVTFVLSPVAPTSRTRARPRPRARKHST